MVIPETLNRSNWCIRQDSHLQTLRSKRSMNVISPRMRKQSPKRTESGAPPFVRPCVVSAGGPDSLGKSGVPCGSCTRLHGFADHCLSCSANGTESESADGMRSLPPAFDFPRDVRSWAMHAQAMVAHYSLVRRKPGLAPTNSGLQNPPCSC